MEGAEVASKGVERQHSVRQLERQKSILDPGKYLRSSSMILKSEEVAIAPPAPAEPLVLGFEALEPLNVKSEDLLPAGPAGVLHGVLENGMRYYVGKNAKPRDRAALALAVPVGSVFEEDGEQGVAHIVEHLAFSATKDYSNHDLVRFLESIGSEFGPCNNAYTNTDETVYKILVPVDRPEIMSEALHVLAEFSTEIRASDEDLEKERGAVLEEWRRGRNSGGRSWRAYIKVLMEGSKLFTARKPNHSPFLIIGAKQGQVALRNAQYADRPAIGEEEVIKSVPGQRVRDFYHTWYRPENMAVIAVGDFANVEDVVKLINFQFAAKQGHVQDRNRSLTTPTFPVPPHDEPRFSCYADPEASESTVDITCKAPRITEKIVKDARWELAERMFFTALNSRLYRISKQTDRPFYSSHGMDWIIANSVVGYTLRAVCPEGGTCKALEQMLTEVARIRLHGFSEREIAFARADQMVFLKSYYLQRDQRQSTELRDNYIEHFLLGDALPSVEYSTRLGKTLVDDILATEVSKVAERFYTTRSCVIKITEPLVIADEEKLKAIVAKVTEMERHGDIATWDEENLPDVLVKDLPAPGVIAETKECPEFEATEITLSNGMRVCYKCTDFYDDEILVRGFAYGGISEIDESDHHSCNMGRAFAEAIGIYGHKPPILNELLAGKITRVGLSLGYYTRSFDLYCSKADFETALQLGHQLFVTKVEATDAEVKLVIERHLEYIKALDRDPQSAFCNRINAVNFGDSFFYKPWTATTLTNVDPKKACQYFNDCYVDPSTFTVIIVGAIDTEEALPLILQYLGGIPKPEKPVMQYNPKSLAVVPVTPASQIIREEVRMDMVEAQCEVYLTFPIHLQGPRVGLDIEKTDFMCKFLETKIMQVLRFKHGKVYNVSVSAFMGGSNPFFYEEIFGHVAVNFSCDPDLAWELVDITLKEIRQLQEDQLAGRRARNDDVETVLELEQREYENCQEDNEYWVNRLRRAYQSKIFSGNLARPLQAQNKLREEVRANTNTGSMKESLCRILPFPCTSDYKAIVLLPNAS